MGTYRDQKKAETRINTGLQPNQAFKVRANGMDWESTGRLAAVMGAIKIAHRGGQNHQPSREEIGERYRREFGALPW